MKTFCFAGGVLSIIGSILCGYFALSARSPDDPPLETPTQIDVGALTPGVEKRVEAQITNTTQDDIEILEMTHTCSCTSASLAQTVIHPRQIILLQLTVKSANVGEFQSAVEIRYRCTEHGTILVNRIICEGFVAEGAGPGSPASTSHGGDRPAD